MNLYIVDAGVAAKWFLDEIFSDDARRLLREGNRLYAPDFLLLEMDNLFCKRIRRGEIAPIDGEEGRLMLKQLPISYHAVASLQNTAYKIAIETKRSLYDCLYLALAVLLNGQMATADKKFFNGLAETPFSNHLLWVADIA